MEAVKRIEAWLEASINAHQSVGVEKQLPWFLDQADWALLFDNSTALQLIGRKHGNTVTLQPGCAFGHSRNCEKDAGTETPMIIAIDGPAASGKGTIARRVASHYGLHHLDTGLIYRAVAKAVLDGGHSPDDVARATAAAVALDPRTFDANALKARHITEAASVVAAIPQVRQALIHYQREFATQPPGAVLDGRDIGTVIVPGADVKLFIVATPEVRAARRARERKARGEPADEREVLAELLRRDERDSSRTAAPLSAAPDAHLLDTTHLSIDAAFRAAVDIIEAVRTGRKRR